ncbi:hypothetical protein HDF17_003430 [Granulicella arctica]|uniref:4-O-methyl-glucuronoyl methylesterase-like domain-containing protein n=1 Tax=Granulicella arctica TaxID=940613 RepID=A0A7Y9PJM2_9BACT|nr:hypothetical protein [Granulicella arctica]
MFLLALTGLSAVAQKTGPAQTSKPVAWPDPLVLESGAPVLTRERFEQQRRGELLSLFAENVYGKTPQATVPIAIVAAKVDEHALDGLAVRKQITLAVGSKGERTWHLLLYTPAHATGPVSVIVGLNFNGNQTVDPDPEIELNPVWVRDPALASTPLAKELSGHVLKIAESGTRGAAAQQWQLHLLLARGYGLATLYAGDIEPDFIGGIGYGVRPLLFGPKQSVPAADDWGAIGAWAWGMSRVVDVLSSDPHIDAKRLIAFGFSRFGKTALWAAAQDQRFALVLSNESGQGGATLSHRQEGEPIDHMMLAFPYWFCGNYQHYLGRTQSLPVDGHLLLSLIAPRPLYVGSAGSDPYSDPEGEFLAVKAVAPVYALYGEQGVTDTAMPPLNHPVGQWVSYHVRPGGHDVTLYDWEQYLNFADRVLGNK